METTSPKSPSMDAREDVMLKQLAAATSNLKTVMSGMPMADASLSATLPSLEARISNLEEKFAAVTNAFEKTFTMCEALEHGHAEKLTELRSNVQQDINYIVDDKFSCWMLELADKDLLSPLKESLQQDEVLLNSAKVKELRIEGMLSMVAERVLEHMSKEDTYIQIKQSVDELLGRLSSMGLDSDRPGGRDVHELHEMVKASAAEIQKLHEEHRNKVSYSEGADGRLLCGSGEDNFPDIVSLDICQEPILEESHEEEQDERDAYCMNIGGSVV
jgi:hypothetical protein